MRRPLRQPSLSQTLKNRLVRPRKTAVLTIGSELRGDDGAGPLIGNTLLKRLKKRRDIMVFFGATAPENLTGAIKTFDPSHLVIIDTVEMRRKKPGAVTVLSPDDIGEDVSFSTHVLPPKVIIDYLLESLDCAVTIIGIQPKSLRFDAAISPAVERAARTVAAALITALTTP